MTVLSVNLVNQSCKVNICSGSRTALLAQVCTVVVYMFVMSMCTPVVYVFWYAGVGGYEGDGDITNPENLNAFKAYVLQQTEGKGVHFVMGDGVSCC